MSTPRESPAGVLSRTGASPFGGSSGDAKLASCEALDPKTRTWQALPEMREARWGCAAWQVGGCIVVAGGVGADGTELDSVEVLDGGVWRAVPDASLPHPVHSAGCVLAPC